MPRVFEVRFPAPMDADSAAALEQQRAARLLWAYTAATRHLWKPRGWLQHLIERRKAVLGLDWRAGVIGMLVRQTAEKSRGLERQLVQPFFDFEGNGPRSRTAGAVPFRVYMEHARRMRAALNVTQLLIMTDAPALPRLASQLAGDFQVRFIDPPQVCYKRPGECYTQRSHKQDLGRLAANIDIMASCNAFVGPFVSNLAALIYQLGRARGHFVQPLTHMSVDFSWNRIV